MTQTISTIVDTLEFFLLIGRLYDPNNFYYCRYERTTTSAMSVYMTQTISTIVDFVNYARRINSLQGIVQIILTLLSCFGVKLLNFV